MKCQKRTDKDFSTNKNLSLVLLRDSLFKHRLSRSLLFPGADNLLIIICCNSPANTKTLFKISFHPNHLFTLTAEVAQTFLHLLVRCDIQKVVNPIAAGFVSYNRKFIFTLALPSPFGSIYVAVKVRVRNRSILVNPSNGGQPCPHLQELDTCWEIELFNWQYGNWENCTLQDPQATCGPGNRTRNKTCVKLSGEFLEDYVCDHHKPSFVSETCRIPCPDDCVLSEWSDWSSCTLPCTGTRAKGNRGATGPSWPSLDQIAHVCRELRGVTSAIPSAARPPTGVRRSGELHAGRKRGNSSCGQGIQVREVLCMENGVVKPPKRCKNLNKPETLRKCPLPCPVDCVMTNFFRLVTM
ncbi:thrombospondin type-1 domain-containing protein 7B [Caerostris extrusa]|uniref:Thrombospondin type-1 domain-containing protein 7B n=1 Tax=Caerostris extrusa TaxID=172846 RepID=A0AAV4TQX5_CAEEX|nr:thrombospondin type-1 domain-containing protein 7B [Caerostris extrusa]